MQTGSRTGGGGKKGRGGLFREVSAPTPSRGRQPMGRLRRPGNICGSPARAHVFEVSVRALA